MPPRRVLGRMGNKQVRYRLEEKAEPPPTCPQCGQCPYRKLYYDTLVDLHTWEVCKVNECRCGAVAFERLIQKL